MSEWVATEILGLRSWWAGSTEGGVHPAIYMDAIRDSRCEPCWNLLGNWTAPGQLPLYHCV